jgi:hypothetical protein
MGRECSTHGRREMRIGFWWESQKERDHYEELDEGERIVLKSSRDRMAIKCWEVLE